MAGTDLGYHQTQRTCKPQTGIAANQCSTILWKLLGKGWGGDDDSAGKPGNQRLVRSLRQKTQMAGAGLGNRRGVHSLPVRSPSNVGTSHTRKRIDTLCGDGKEAAVNGHGLLLAGRFRGIDRHFEPCVLGAFVKPLQHFVGDIQRRPKDQG